MSLGWSSAQIRIKHLSKKSYTVEQSKRVSVVYFDEVDGVRVIDWPKHPGHGILLIPRLLSEAGWVDWTERR